MFEPIIGFQVDDETKIYYNIKYQSCVIRSDMIFEKDEEPDWYINCIKHTPLKDTNEYLIWINENDPLIRASNRIPHWSINK